MPQIHNIKQDDSLTRSLFEDESDVNALESGQIYEAQELEFEEFSEPDESFYSPIIVYGEWLANFRHLVILFLPNIDILTDFWILIYFFYKGEDYEFWAIFLAIILALSLRIQTFWFLIFFFYVESGDEEEFKHQDSMIMYVPFFGPFVASYGLVGEIGYDGGACGRLVWIFAFEVVLWVGVPFMCVTRLFYATRSWLQWLSFLLCDCQKNEANDPRNDDNQGKIISQENRHILFAFVNSCEALYEAFPQFIIQLTVILGISRGNTNTIQYISLSTSGLVTGLGFHTALTKMIRANQANN